jgi:hypothetical protein
MVIFFMAVSRFGLPLRAAKEFTATGTTAKR